MVGVVVVAVVVGSVGVIALVSCKDDGRRMRRCFVIRHDDQRVARGEGCEREVQVGDSGCGARGVRC